jgi:hypothetical protein
MFGISNDTYDSIYRGLRRLDGTHGAAHRSDAETSDAKWRIWAPSLAFAVIAALIIV